MRGVAVITSELIASGLSQAQTALLMELVLSMSTGTSGANPVESPEHRTLERRRAWDRDRKRREREAKKPSTLSTGHPPYSTGKSGGNEDVCLVVEVKKEVLQEGKERKKGSRLLSNARMSESDRAFAITEGCPPDTVDRMWSEFVDYWIGVAGSKGVKLDWSATWRNRVRQVSQKYKATNVNGLSNYRTDPAAGRATTREAQQVAALGRAAANRLASRASAGTNGEAPGSTGTAEIIDIRNRAESAG